MYLGAHKNLPLPATTPPDQVNIVKLELDKTVVKEFAREYIGATMAGVSSELQDEMFSFVCTYQGCKYETQAINFQWCALELLKFHLTDVHSWQEDETADYIFEKVEDNDAKNDSVTVIGVDEDGMMTIQFPEIYSPQPRVGGVEVHDCGDNLHKGHNLTACGGLGDAPDGGEEVQPEEFQRPVLSRRSSVKQFNSFKLDWDQYTEEYRSRYREEHGEEDSYKLNYLLNYELLASVPEHMEDAIYKAMPLKEEQTISTATLLMEIKKITVREAVEHAQQSMVQTSATEPVQHTVEEALVGAMVNI